MVQKIIKSILPASGVEKLKKIGELIANFTLRIAVSSKFLSSLYYILIAKDFRRENQAVIYGKLKYIEDLQSNLDSQYLLRRNIHRLEKGIIMQPRRDIFALDYIDETIKCYEKSVLDKGKDLPESTELQWAHDVLEQYFTIVGANPAIEPAKTRFLALDKPDRNGKQKVPYKRNPEEPSPVNYDDLLKLAYRRRSVRWYEQKPVPRELIDKAIAVAALSPSACNRQPFEFRIFDDPNVVKKVASIPMGTKGFSHNFPVIIVVVGKLRAYFSERDRHVIYIDAALASMSFMYALETLGLSSCPINWPDIEEREKVMEAAMIEIMAKRTTRWKKEGKKIILLPQAFGPFEQKAVRNAFLEILKNADLVFARDRVSYNYLIELNSSYNSKIKMAPDFTNLVQGEVPNYFKTNPRHICIVPNYRMIQKTSPELKAKYISFLVTNQD